jgi:hypothetical protein
MTGVGMGILRNLRTDVVHEMPNLPDLSYLDFVRFIAWIQGVKD